jgi:hypothetical protein
MEAMNEKPAPFMILEPDRSIGILGHVTQK